VKGAVLLVAAGAVMSLAIFRGIPPPQLLAALEAQAPVFSWDAAQARARFAEGVLVVDGRKGGPGARPKDAVRVPFEERYDEVLVLPASRQFRAALVVMEAARTAEARELAQWLAREWALPEVATFRGGFEAWVAAGLPVETR
jgi:hypothetical protein